MPKENAMGLQDQIIQDNLKTPRRWLGLRLAQSAGLVQDALAMTAQGRKQEREIWEYQKGLLGMASTKDQAPTEDDDVGNIVVGDQQTTVYNMAQAQSGLAKFAKAATIGAALLGAGGAGAVATAWLCGIFDKPKAAAPVTTTAPAYDPDGYGLKIVPDSEIKE